MGKPVIALSEVGQRLAKAREGAGFTQAQAARALGIDTMTLSRWERTGRVKARDVVAAAQLYRVTPESINPRLANHVGEIVPRGTIPGTGSTDGPRLPWNRAVNGPKASEWRRAFRKELQDLGALPDEEDNAVDTVRASGEHTYNAERLDWTEEEAIQAMEVSADSFRRYFARLKRHRQ